MKQQNHRSLLACVFLALALSLPRLAFTASPPNVLQIISDDQAWTDYSFMGHPHIQTPALDRLARQSLTFTRGYVTAPLCRPSLASIITGLFPHQHGITGNDPDLPDPGVNAMTGRRNPKYARYYETLMHRIEEHPTLPRLLAQHGYVSLQTGKWWEGPARRGGFTEGMTHGDPKRGGRHGDAGLTIGRQGLQPIYDFIERATAAQKPFFIWYAPFMPHAPHTPPERLLAKYRDKAPTIAVARYWAMCEWFDETCGELVKFLDEHQLAGNTLVVYVADNGWIQDPKRPNRFAPRSKRTPYEGGIRTPIMLRWPGHITPRMDKETPVSSIDLAPTILRACGVEPPSGLPGLNLLDRRALAARPRIFGEAYAHNVADVDHPTRSLEYRWVIEGFWKLILPEPKVKQPPAPELYNLFDDPYEKHDMAAQQPERVEHLRREIETWWRETAGDFGKTEQPATTALRRTSSDSPKTSRPPNILFFFTDDQRNDTLGCAGHPIIKTPTIDRLAAQGVRFANMFVSHSICWVSRTSILTGLTARSFGERDMPDKARPDALKALYPDLLHAAGYRTGFFGKWHAKMPRGFKPEEHFDVFESIWRHPYYHKMPDGSLRHTTEIIGDRAIEFLKSQPKDRPFCLNLWFNAAHAEDGDHRPGIGHYPWPRAMNGMYDGVHVPPPRLNDPAIFDSQPEFLKTSINRERYFWRWDTARKYQINMRAYFRMISGIDRVIQRVLKVLEEQGLADNTIVVYSADNGYYMGDRGFAGKWSHYEQSLRVPLIIYDPRLASRSRGRVVEELALNLDLPATFLDWAGLPIPDSYQGRSLRPIVEGQTPAGWRTDFFCEHVTLRPKLSWEGVRTTRYKYARYFDQRPVYEFLFDLKNDPDELNNLATRPEAGELLKALRARCEALVAKYGGPLKPLAGNAPR